MPESRKGLAFLRNSIGAVQGPFDSLPNDPAIMTHSSIPTERPAPLGLFDGLVRQSVGAEDVDGPRRGLEAAPAR